MTIITNSWFLFLISANIFEFLRTMWWAETQWGARAASVLCVERAVRVLWRKYLENIEFKRSQPVWALRLGAGLSWQVRSTQLTLTESIYLLSDFPISCSDNESTSNYIVNNLHIFFVIGQLSLDHINNHPPEWGSQPSNWTEIASQKLEET